MHICIYTYYVLYVTVYVQYSPHHLSKNAERDTEASPAPTVPPPFTSLWARMVRPMVDLQSDHRKTIGKP